jgi:membrane fusion protein, multidrug efflux system
VGKTVAREVVSVQPQVSGRITQIHFTDGANVKIGDLLFTIDPRPYQAQLNQAEANVAQAEAALSLAKVNFARVEQVSDPRAVSRQDFDARKSAVETAEATLKQNRAAVENARLNLEYCTIRSPINGRAGQRTVDVGNVVSANSGSLLVIQRLDPIYADFTVTESELSGVQRNMAKQALKVEVRLPDDGTEPREGKLTFLDNSVQEGSGTVKLRATLNNNDRSFWPGRFVKVRLILQTQRDAVLVPADAPQLSAKGPFVYVVKPDSSAELRPVKVGQRQEDLIVIKDGLKADERVVVSGQLGVTPGGKVRVLQPTDPAKATPSANPPAKS